MFRAARQALRRLSSSGSSTSQSGGGHERNLVASCVAYQAAALHLESQMCDRKQAGRQHGANGAAALPATVPIRGFSSIIYPPVEARVGEKAPDFTLPGEMEVHATIFGGDRDSAGQAMPAMG